VERSCEPMDKNRIEGAAEQGERARSREALVIKAKWRKSGGCAVKVTLRQDFAQSQMVRLRSFNGFSIYPHGATMTDRRYRAFVSYSQTDKAFAKKLHGALETFKLPNGKELGRFFRDDVELGSAASLGAALRGAIEDSEDLIVIASPRSAQSRWVNEEVIHFKKSAAQGKQVFAVIVDGKPNAVDPKEECFVPALRECVTADGTLTGVPDEPFAPDARNESFKRLVTKVAAGLSGIPFDDLWQREKRRAQNRAFLSSLGLAVMVSLGWFAWDASRTAQQSSKKLATLDPENQRANFVDTYYEKLYPASNPDFRKPREVFEKALRIMAAEDINDDGYQDYLVKFEHSDYCGSGGCLQELLVNDAGVYRSVLSDLVFADFEVFETQTNGFRDIAVRDGTTLLGTPVQAILHYNGIEYAKVGYVICGRVLSSYCGLSEALDGGGNSAMVFFVDNNLVNKRSTPTTDTLDGRTSTDDAGYVYQSVEDARAENKGTAVDPGWDMAVGTDRSGEFTLIDTWKHDYGVRRNKVLKPPVR